MLKISNLSFLVILQYSTMNSGRNLLVEELDIREDYARNWLKIYKRVQIQVLAWVSSFGQI